MEKLKRIQIRPPSPFAWLMIFLCLLLALGLAILIYGLSTPTGGITIDL